MYKNTVGGHSKKTRTPRTIWSGEVDLGPFVACLFSIKLRFSLLNMALWALSTTPPLLVASSSVGAFCVVGAEFSPVWVLRGSGEPLPAGRIGNCRSQEAGFSEPGWELVLHCCCFAALWWQHAVAPFSLKSGSCLLSPCLVVW